MQGVSPTELNGLLLEDKNRFLLLVNYLREMYETTKREIKAPKSTDRYRAVQRFSEMESIRIPEAKQSVDTIHRRRWCNSTLQHIRPQMLAGIKCFLWISVIFWLGHQGGTGLRCIKGGVGSCCALSIDHKIGVWHPEQHLLSSNPPLQCILPHFAQVNQISKWTVAAHIVGSGNSHGAWKVLEGRKRICSCWAQPHWCRPLRGLWKGRKWFH